jgi:hypothetical protein
MNATCFKSFLRPIVALSVLAGLSVPVSATPPDLICTGEMGPLGFQVNLQTTGTLITQSGVEPLAIQHSKVTVGPLDEGAGPVNVSLSSQDLKGQWLDDGRVDLHIYKEHTTAFPRLMSIDLKIKTKSTGKRDEDSGQLIHTGEFELRVYTGSRRKGSTILFSRTRGKAECR